MTKTFILTSAYSTTRWVTREIPVGLKSLPPNQERKGESGLRTKGYFKTTLPDKPLVSIITVVFNGRKYLEETILSVLTQTYDNVEYIIIDGGSTDGTLDIICKYEDAIDYWVSESDKGISDAFNKGISCSTGEIIGIINADDWYEKEAVQFVINAFLEDRQVGVLCGLLQYWKGDKKDYCFSSNPAFLNKEMTINHPTVFVKKEIYQKFGAFDESYRYAMDYELVLRFFYNSVKFRSLNHVLSNMRLKGTSDKNWMRALSEVRNAKMKYSPRTKAYIYFYYQILRKSFSKILDRLSLSVINNLYRSKFSILKKTR